MLSRLTTAQVDVEDFALVTHAVPAERVRPHVPEMFELDTFPAEDGVETALITTACFCNRGCIGRCLATRPTTSVR